ncbi:MAG: carboxypeptidase-like regulatory domain-containing protein [Spirochaetaceae bacterium]|nr:carboxypeptidase-like regulatory domain-containing protein [Spirochaetaceae bacterium]
MHIRVLAFLLIILFAIFALSCNSAKGRIATGGGIMYAMIYDHDNIPVSGVVVKINGKEIVKSDVHGRFILDFKKNGEYEIELSKKGYETLTQKFEYNPMNVLYFKLITAEQLVALAEEELNKFCYEEAEKYLQRASILEPLRAEIIYLRSINFVLQDKYVEAKRVFRELKEKGYDNKYIELLEEKIEEGIISNDI